MSEPPAPANDTPGAVVSILHVDDDALVRDLVQVYLERYSDDGRVRSVGSATRALELLETEQFDCVVSDYQMPGVDGLEFLERFRAIEPDVPFILFTGRGSEEVASKAIERGVTDYLQKGQTERLELLWNRIRHAVDSYRRRTRLRTETRKFRAVFEQASDAMLLADEEGIYVDANEAACDLFGVPKEELLGKTVVEFAPPDFDFVVAWERFLASDAERGTFPLVRPDGSQLPLEYSAVPNIVPGLSLSILRPVGGSGGDSGGDGEGYSTRAESD